VAVKTLSLPVRRRAEMLSTAAPKVTWVGRARTLAYWLLAVVVAASIGVLLTANPAHAIAFDVNSTEDDGDNDWGDNECSTEPHPPGTEPNCTLRAAIQETNANNNDATAVVDSIEFNIPETGVQVISPATSLDEITEPVTIDGYTQRPCSEGHAAPCSRKNTNAIGQDNAVLLIRLDGSSLGDNAVGLNIDTSDSVVRGLSVTRFTGSGSAALFVDGPNNTASNNTIEGNFVGTDPSGTRDLGSRWGVLIGESGNTVGGTSPGARNIISGNDEGLSIVGSATNNKVMGNYIGTTRSGTGDLGNSNLGVSITAGGFDNEIGGASRAEANTIAFNGDTANEGGVRMFGDDATGNSILSNSIFSNAGMGIDLSLSFSGDGVTANDGVGDADTGANNLQNFPVISSAKTGLTATTIKGTLRSTQNGTFLIQFFSNPEDTRDEGKKFIGQKRVTDTDGDGITFFTFKPVQRVKAGLFVTSTATKVAIGDTSEFSAPKKVQ
jgi:CSLREA domain-containing protein